MSNARPATADGRGLLWHVTTDLLSVSSASGLLEETNPAWKVALGYTSQEIESRPFFDFVHPDDQEITQRAFADIRAGNPVLSFENRYRHKDGSYRWLSWNAVPDDGRFYCSARDVTEDKLNQASLKSRDEEALLREQFIAVLGHDLRNPLAAVEAGLGMLARENLTARGQIVIDESAKATRRMFALIDDLMDFARSRLGSGLSLDFEGGCDIASAMNDIVTEITSAHPEVRIEVDVDVGGAMRCDMARICQMTSNLIANAVTHGSDVDAIRLRARGNSDFLAISVTNSGKPIPESVREHLFEPFVRDGGPTANKGLGLGLYICAQIARAHGGNLEVRSDEKETVFTFTMGDASSAHLVGWS